MKTGLRNVCSEIRRDWSHVTYKTITLYIAVVVTVMLVLQLIGR